MRNGQHLLIADDMGLCATRGTSLDPFAKATRVSEALESDKLTLIVFVGESPRAGSSAGFRPKWL